VIRIFLAFGDATFGERLFEYLNEQPDLQVCGKGEIRDEVVRGAIELRPDIAILETAAENDLAVANGFKQHIPSLPLPAGSGKSKPGDRKKGPGTWRGCRVSNGR
jgi:chemotaxis response regulator CheB